MHAGLFSTLESPAAGANRYPFNAWTSLGFIVPAIAMGLNGQYLASAASASLSIVSFFWWWTQTPWLRTFDLWLVAFLFLFPPMMKAKLSHHHQLWVAGDLLILVAFFERTMSRANVGVIVAAAACSLQALRGMHYSLCVTLIASVVIKATVPKYGTGIFHVLTAAALACASIIFAQERILTLN